MDFNVRLVANPNFYKVCSSRVRNIPLKKSSAEHMVAGGKFIHPNSAFKVENLKFNFAVVLQSLEQRFAVQIPVDRYASYASEQLNIAISNVHSGMKKSYDHMRALIAGGHEFDSELPCTASGRQLMDRLMTTLDDNNIPFTILAEQKNNIGNGRGISIYAFGDDINIYDGVVNSTKGTNTSTKEEVESALNELFYCVEVSDEVPVSFVDDVPRWVPELNSYVLQK